MTGKYEAGRTTAFVPKEVYDFISDMQKDDPDAMSSIATMIKIAKERKLKKVVSWLKDNPLAYGIGFWGDFQPSTLSEDPNVRPQRKKKEKS